MELYKQLEEARKRRDIGPSELAKETGIPLASLYRYLEGLRGLSRDNLDKLCDALGVELTDK